MSYISEVFRYFFLKFQLLHRTSILLVGCTYNIIPVSLINWRDFSHYWWVLEYWMLQLRLCMYMEVRHLFILFSLLQMNMDLSVQEGHLCNMGRMIEEMESKLRNSLDQVRFLPCLSVTWALKALVILYNLNMICSSCTIWIMQVYFGKTKEMVCTLRPPSEVVMRLPDSWYGGNTWHQNSKFVCFLHIFAWQHDLLAIGVFVPVP